MICQYCNKNEATTHIKKIVNGEKTELHICPTCAKALGYSSPFDSVFDFSAPFGSLFKELDGFSPRRRSSELRCEKCGCTFDDIVRTGKVGCADCYRVFYDKLLPSINRLHGSSGHCGKLPSSADYKDKKARRIDELKEKLNKAVDEQNFEQAAAYRDEIKALEEQQ